MPVVELPVHAQTRRRVRNRLPLVVVVWVGCVAGVSWVSSTRSFGPVVAELTARRGLHAGDLVLAGVVAIGATAVTWLLLRPVRPDTGSDEDQVDVVAVELRRLPAVVALWFAVMVSSLWAAFETTIGPVLFVYNDHRSVRLGELVYSVAAIVLACVLTVALLRPSSPRAAAA